MADAPDVASDSDLDLTDSATVGEAGELSPDVKICKAACDTLVEQYNHGDDVPHDVIWGLVELTYPKDSWSVARAKQEKLVWLRRWRILSELLLHEHKMVLDSLPGFGYRIMTPQDQNRRALRDAVEAAQKAYARAKDRLHNIRRDMLTDAERAANADRIARADQLARMLVDRRAERYKRFR